MTTRKLSLRGRLLSIALAGLAACVLVGGIAFVNIRSLGAAEAAVSDDATPSLLITAKINDAVSNIREKQLKVVLAQGQQQVAADEADMGRFIAAMQPLAADYEKRVDNDEERKLFGAVRGKFDEFVKHANATLADVKSGDPAKLETARALARSAGSKLFDELGTAIDELSAFNEKAVAQTHAEAQVTASRAATMLIGAMVLAAAVLLVLALSVIRGLVRQIGGEPEDAALLARAVAQGDLTTHIALRAGDSDSVMAQLAAMQGSLSKIVGSVRINAEGLATTSAEIAQGNSDLSGRTEQQASALEETAASMEELSSTVKQNADNARQANQLAMGASGVAIEGGAVVAQVVDTMKGINDSSKKIVDIIGVIDGIAFQTNILALNAAVEAARAGEQGRGFAVVASEVRSLAQRSADAAKEIKGLIGQSVDRVEAGSRLVQDAGSTMGEIVVSVKRVTDMISEISAASNEQSQGIGQVNVAVNQLDQMTQQNAALVEESAAAAESLKDQAQRLSGIIGTFRLSGQGMTTA